MNGPAQPPLVRRAGLADVPLLAPLFDAYRQFYEQPPNLALAQAYLRERLERSESVVLLAEAAAPADASKTTEPKVLGFSQLYPSFCSVQAAPIHVLYDLFVAPEARRSGTARALLTAARAQAQQAGSVRLDLSTARSNTQAQALYESLGWVRDELFWVYSLELR